VPAEPKTEAQQRAKAVILVDRTPDRQISPGGAGNRLAPSGGEGHRARCELSPLDKLNSQLDRSAQHVAEIDTGSGTADPAGNDEVYTKTRESQTEIPPEPLPVRYLSPPEVARLVPGGTSDEAVYRWIRRGVKHHGRRVKLAAVRVGGRWKVSREALKAFLSTINPGLPGPAVARAVDYGADPAIPTAGPRDARRLARARERLKAMGLA
jgi:excisionase family DNA binding protein